MHSSNLCLHSRHSLGCVSASSAFIRMSVTGCRTYPSPRWSHSESLHLTPACDCFQIGHTAGFQVDMTGVVGWQHSIHYKEQGVSKFRVLPRSLLILYASSSGCLGAKGYVTEQGKRRKGIQKMPNQKGRNTEVRLLPKRTRRSFITAIRLQVKSLPSTSSE